MKSATELDQWTDLHGQTYKDALGEVGQKKLEEFDREGLESSETQLFIISPKMSYAPKEWIDVDPEFWSPKSGVMPAAKSHIPKTERERQP